MQKLFRFKSEKFRISQKYRNTRSKISIIKTMHNQQNKRLCKERNDLRVVFNNYKEFDPVFFVLKFFNYVKFYSEYEGEKTTINC